LKSPLNFKGFSSLLHRCSTLGSLPGDSVHALMSELPAATTTGSPASTSAATALSSVCEISPPRPFRF
jgi:hypothetical protein